MNAMVVTMNRTPIVIPMIAPVESVDVVLGSGSGGAVHKGLSLHLQITLIIASFVLSFKAHCLPHTGAPATASCKSTSQLLFA